jgi:hypothetical protein
VTVRSDLPKPVFDLIERSFNDRIAKVPNSDVARINRPVPATGFNAAKNWVMNKIDNIVVRPGDYSGGNLDNAFEKKPASLDDLLERCLTLRDLSNLTKLFDRSRIVTSGTSFGATAVWDGLHWVRRGWSTSSFGCDVNYTDRAAQRALYDGLVTARKLVRDGPGTAAEHPGCSCWRELPSGTGSTPRDSEVLHLLIGDGSVAGTTPTDQERFDSIHIDYVSPCKTTSVDVCNESLRKDVGHGLQVFLNIGIPASPFSFPDVDAELQEADKAGFVDPSGSAKAATLRAEFAKFSRTWACQGYAGEVEAQKRFDQLEEIRKDTFDRELFLRAVESGALGGA